MNEFSSDSELHNADELENYRSLSSLSVLALCVGMASPLALAAPIWAAVPVAAIALAGLALAKIHYSGEALTGSLLAKIALILGVVFLLAPVTHGYVRETSTIGQAREVAERWLNAITSQEWNEAGGMVIPSKLYQITPRPGGPKEPNPNFTIEDGIAFLPQETFMKLLASQASLEAFTPEENGSTLQWKPKSPEVGFRFRFFHLEDEQTCSVVLSRQKLSTGKLSWVVKDWQVAPASDSR